MTILFSALIMLFANASAVPAKTLGLPKLQKRDQSNSVVATIELGKKLFFDKRLSKNGKISCASCHQPEQAFSDGQPLAVGINGQVGARNTPSLINVAFNQSQFWDGRRTTLEEQAQDPFFNPREHGLEHPRQLLAILSRDNGYRKAFRQAFGNETNAISLPHVGRAIASFERDVLLAGDSPFDRYYFNGNQQSLSPEQVRGLALFTGRANCSSCHTIDPKGTLFSDNQFHSLSVGLKRISLRLAELTSELIRVRADGTSLDQAVSENADFAELGRFALTLDPVDIGKFKTPSLRNVALTAPYMHDGSVPTLEQAVELEIYYRSTESNRPLILTPTEKSDLVQFLRALTSPHTRSGK